MIDQETLKIFDELYQTTYNDVLKYVVLSCSNIADAEDIMQNIYIAVLKNIKKNRQQDKAYIIGISKNKVKNYYRFKYRNKLINYFEREEMEALAVDDTLEESVLIKSNIDSIWEFLKNKKSEIPKIFYLYYYMGYTIKEISNELNLKESTIKNNIYRTLNELKLYLDKKAGENGK